MKEKKDTLELTLKEYKEIMVNMIKPKNCVICSKKVMSEEIPKELHDFIDNIGIKSKIYYPHMCKECTKKATVFN